MYLCSVELLTEAMKKIFLIIFAVITTPLVVQAQIVEKELKADFNRASGMFYARKAGKMPKDTPAPSGKKPFYINHYGCPGSYYLDKSEYYTETYAVLAKADSLGKLTKLGKDVLRRISMLYQDAEGRYGELTTEGAKQIRSLMKQMVERFPDMFTPKGYYSVRSIVLNRCIMTMEEALLQLSSMQQPLVARSKASLEELKFMDGIDKELASQRIDSLTRISYDHFTALNSNDGRLMTSLFNDQSYVLSNIDAGKLSKQLYILASDIQHIDIAGLVTLWDIFTPEEIYRHWRKQNAWHYINYGGYTLNGGYQAYMQRAVLRNMIHMGDSVLKRYNPLMHLRYTNSQVVMSLACLMDLDGYGLHTDNLDSLEHYGWANYRIAPLGGSIEMIHYRKDRDDPDVLVKVLLNGKEARLPIETDCAPYYHWQDVKTYYLRKLYRYENRRFKNKAKR
jgi:hypothetical protein